jgi:D-aminoacyl-tRNA deacylase
VSRASVCVDQQVIGEIGNGLLVYLGIERGDQADDMCWVLKKLLGIRVFDDPEGKMNESLTCDEGIMLISQFTLFGNLKKGFRPSFNRAAEPLDARRLFEEFLNRLQSEFTGTVAVGAFGEHMDIEAVDDGPVSLWLDSRQRGY